MRADSGHDSDAARRLFAMAKIAELTLNGSSGTGYTFDVYPVGTAFRAVSAVYVVTRRERTHQGFSHAVLYVGQTSDLGERFLRHHKASCFARNGANCIG